MNKAAVGITCLVLGLLLFPLAGLAYLRYGHPPVAVKDPAFPMEARIVHQPLNARIDREMPSGSPVPDSPEAFMAGAAVYQQQCAFCHGVPRKASVIGPNMYPSAPQLWKAHGHDVVGVSDDPVGETYWKVKNGIRLAGMPAFANILSEEQMWQVSLLLASANKPLAPELQARLAPN